MSNRLTLDQIVRQGGRPDVTLVHIEHQQGDLRCWDGLGILDYDGHEWLGLGRLGSIGIAPSDTSIEVQDVVFTLSGVDAQYLDLLDTSVKGNIATVWKAFLTDDYRVDVLVMLSEAECDTLGFMIEPNGMAKVELRCIGGFFMLEAQSAAKWDTEEQRNYLTSLELDPTSDSGFDLVPSMKQKKIAWLPE